MHCEAFTHWRMKTLGYIVVCMSKKNVKSTSKSMFYLLLGGLALVVFFILMSVQRPGVGGTIESNTEKKKQMTIVPPVGWQEVANEYYSIHIPADWKSYEYSNDKSASLCPVSQCQDGRVWIEMVYMTSVDEEVEKLTQNKLYRTVAHEITPIQFSDHMGKAVHFEPSDAGSSNPVYAYIQRGDDVVNFGYYESDQLSQDILTTFVIK